MENLKTHPSRMLRIGELCELLGVTQPYIYRLVKSGKYPAPVKLPDGGTRWPMGDALGWMQQLKRGVGSGVDRATKARQAKRAAATIAA